MENLLGYLEARGPDALRRLLQREADRQHVKRATGENQPCDCSWIDALHEIDL
jgi:hypothetical protein